MSPARPVVEHRLDHHTVGDGGRWVTVTGEIGRVVVDVGSTGNSLDPDRRVRRSRVEFTRRGDRVAVHLRWPVAELVTHRAGQVVDDLRGELTEAGDDHPDATLTAAARMVAGDTGGDDRDSLAGVVLAGAYPLLTAPLAAGARPTEIPVPVESILRHATARVAADCALTPGATTRPLVRALARSLLPDERGVVAWERPTLALMAAPRCGPEQITSILQAPVHHPGAVAFSVADVQRARWMLSERHPRRAAETLCAALSQAGGTRALADEIAAFGQRPPPPPPTPPPAERPTRPRPAPPQEPDVNRRPIAHPPMLLAVEDQSVAGLTVRLPRTADELLEWGTAMHNCLGAYRSAVAAGRTHIVGFAREGRLELVAEVSHGRVLRQLEAPANTQPASEVAASVVEFLRWHRVVEADGRRG